LIFTISILVLLPTLGLTFGQTILDFIVTPSVSSATESTSVVSSVSQMTIPDPVIVNGTSTPAITNATESTSVVSSVSQMTIPDPVIVNGTSNPTNTTATESISVVNPASFAQTPTVSTITKTTFTSDGTSFVPQPEPVIVLSIITKSNFTSIGTSFIPQPEPVITTTIITKSTFESVGTITTAQVSHNFCDPAPTTGDWIIESSCTLSLNTTINGNVVIQNNSVLTIPSSVTLEIDFLNHNLTIESGSGVLIKSGGSLQILS